MMLPTGVLVLCIANIGSSIVYFGNDPSKNERQYDMVKNIVFAHTSGVKNFSKALSIPDRRDQFSDQNVPAFKPLQHQAPYIDRQPQPYNLDNHQYKKMGTQIEKRYTHQNNPSKETITRRPNMAYYTKEKQFSGGMEVNKLIEDKPISNEVPHQHQKQTWFDPSMTYPTKNKLLFTNNVHLTNSKASHEPQVNKSNQHVYFFNRYFVDYNPHEKFTLTSEPVEQHNGFPLNENAGDGYTRSSAQPNQFQKLEVQHQVPFNIPPNEALMNTPWYGFKMTPPSCLQCSHLKWLNDYYSLPQMWQGLNGFILQNGATKQKEFMDQYEPFKFLPPGHSMIHDDRLNFDRFLKQAEGNRDHSSYELTTLVPVSVTRETNQNQPKSIQTYDFRSPRLMPYPYMSPDKLNQRVTTQFGPEDARTLTNGDFSSGIKYTTEDYSVVEPTSDPKSRNIENNYNIPENGSNTEMEDASRSSTLNFQQRQPFFYTVDSGQWRPLVPKMTENQISTTPSFSLLNYEYQTATPSYQSPEPINSPDFARARNSSGSLINEEFNNHNTAGPDISGSSGEMNSRSDDDYPSKPKNTDSIEKRSEMEYEDQTETKDQTTESYKEGYSEREEDDRETKHTQGTEHLRREDERPKSSFQSNDPAGFGKGQLPKLQRYFRILPITGRYEEYYPSGFR